MNNYEESKKLAFEGRFNQIPHLIKELEQTIKRLEEEKENILKIYPEFNTQT